MDLTTKYGEVKIFAKTIEQEAMSQIVQFANSELGEDSHIRIMSDCHAGKGCVIGTTMQITDKICPNLVGVDIACGVDLVRTNIDFSDKLDELDHVIREKIPHGMTCQKNITPFNFTSLKCWQYLTKDSQDLSQRSLGTLGGGNHFIESYKDGYLSVHSGSRNIGWKVAEFYQKLAIKEVKEHNAFIMKELIKNIPEKDRQEWIKENKIVIDESLSFLTGKNMEDYLHDTKIINDFAVQNRKQMLKEIVDYFGGDILDSITSTHNYIDTEKMILRKGAISAQEGEKLVIPMNMRDGLLICVGKGNEDWNCSAPHGAGRLYSRSNAKKIFELSQYKESMKGIYSTCISEKTIDEAPFVYKDIHEIMECIAPTVDIIERLIPIYNFKSD